MKQDNNLSAKSWGVYAVGKGAFTKYRGKAFAWQRGLDPEKIQQIEKPWVLRLVVWQNCREGIVREEARNE